MQLSLFYSDQNGPNSAKKLYWKVRTGNINLHTVFDQIRAYNNLPDAEIHLKQHLELDSNNTGYIYQETLSALYEL